VKPPSSAAFSFDGGVSGLGKTKPVTGVKLFEESSTPIHFDDTRLIGLVLRADDGSNYVKEFLEEDQHHHGGDGYYYEDDPNDDYERQQQEHMKQQEEAERR
jgi:hypothetical protein